MLFRSWKEAEDFFEICVTAPAQTPAAIQLEALKKLTLEQLILYGKVRIFNVYGNENETQAFHSRFNPQSMHTQRLCASSSRHHTSTSQRTILRRRRYSSIRSRKTSRHSGLYVAATRSFTSWIAAVVSDQRCGRQEQNYGLVQQAIERAPRWLIRKLTRTYMTLGLRDIARESAIETEDEVRTILVSMVCVVLASFQHRHDADWIHSHVD